MAVIVGPSCRRCHNENSNRATFGIMPRTPDFFILLRTFTMNAQLQAHTGQELVLKLDDVRMGDIDQVGGKNASLGEMISQLAGSGVRVPGGFCTTAHAFREFLRIGGLDRRIAEALAGLDADDVRALAQVGEQIRQWIVETPLPADLESAIRAAYEELTAASPESTFAVRSSATAEDLPDASRRPSSTSAGSMPCWTRSGMSSRRCTTTAPSRTASTRVSSTATSRSRRACSAWCAATRRCRA
jgi:hypothetical protein